MVLIKHLGLLKQRSLDLNVEVMTFHTFLGYGTSSTGVNQAIELLCFVFLFVLISATHNRFFSSFVRCPFSYSKLGHDTSNSIYTIYMEKIVESP